MRVHGDFGSVRYLFATSLAILAILVATSCNDETAKKDHEVYRDGVPRQETQLVLIAGSRIVALASYSLTPITPPGFNTR